MCVADCVYIFHKFDVGDIEDYAAGCQLYQSLRNTELQKISFAERIFCQELRQRLFMFPLLLKCVYVCKTARQEHFSVQIRLVLLQQPQIPIKTNTLKI